MDGLRDRIVRIAEASHPLSVRNLFYQLLSDDGSGAMIEKLESSCQKVGRLKTQLCRDRIIPWGYFTDSSRVSYDNGGYEGPRRPRVYPPLHEPLQAQRVDRDGHLSSAMG